MFSKLTNLFKKETSFPSYNKDGLFQVTIGERKKRGTYKLRIDDDNIYLTKVL